MIKLFKNVPVVNKEQIFGEKIDEYCDMHNVINLTYSELSTLLDLMHNYDNDKYCHRVINHNDMRIDMVLGRGIHEISYMMLVDYPSNCTRVSIYIEYVKFIRENNFKCSIVIKDIYDPCTHISCQGDITKYKRSFSYSHEIDYNLIKNEIMSYLEENYKLKPIKAKSARSVL